MLKPWRFEGASCNGIEPEFYFPTNKTLSTENRIAKRLCQSCVVQKECLDYALRYQVQGIWGGTHGGERTKLRKQLNIIPIPISEGKL